MALGWIIGSAPSETAAVDNYWDGDQFVTVLNDAQFLSEAAGVTIEAARATEGDFQQRFTDRDVRLLRAEQSIDLV